MAPCRPRTWTWTKSSGRNTANKVILGSWLGQQLCQLLSTHLGESPTDPQVLSTTRTPSSGWSRFPRTWPGLAQSGAASRPLSQCPSPNLLKQGLLASTWLPPLRTALAWLLHSWWPCTAASLPPLLGTLLMFTKPSVPPGLCPLWPEDLPLQGWGQEGALGGARGDCSLRGAGGHLAPAAPSGCSLSS